ncbi:hypothetical protein ACR8KM_22495, partial [Salmonella enterica subsp. enterica serovar Paratyphi A]
MLQDTAASAWGAETTMHISTITHATFFTIISDDLAAISRRGKKWNAFLSKVLRESVCVFGFE